MEALLVNPNVVYLMLVVGSLLAIMAVVTPGTGILEVGALFVLLIAGWGIYRSENPINVWALLLLLLGVGPFMLALRKSKRLIFLALALIVFVIGSAYLFQGDAWWQPGVNPVFALVVSALTSLYLWIATSKALEAEKAPPRHDLRSLVGQVGEAKTDIHSEGSAQVAGELWSARSAESIPAGASVRVVGREGFILDVEKAS